MTGAGWNDILNPLLAQPPDCNQNYKKLPNGNCGNPTLATLYLVSFIVLSSMIVINMYIAVLLENFNQVRNREKDGNIPKTKVEPSSRAVSVRIPSAFSRPLIGHRSVKGHQQPIRAHT